MAFFTSSFLLSAPIFCFLNKKAKGFPFVSGLGDQFSKEKTGKNGRFQKKIERQKETLCLCVFARFEKYPQKTKLYILVLSRQNKAERGKTSRKQTYL